VRKKIAADQICRRIKPCAFRANGWKELLRLRRSTAATVAVAATITTVAWITTSTTATAFAGTLVEFFAATTARAFVLALRTITATTGLLHTAGAAAVLALVDGAGLWFRRAGAIARSECDFEFVKFVPLGVGTVAIRDRKQFLHARAWRRR
jgi:hypothetical protein